MSVGLLGWMALSLSACGAGGHSLSFPDATPAQFDVAQAAATEWTSVCGVTLPLSRGDGDVLVVVVPAGSLGAHIGQTSGERDPELVRIDARYGEARWIYVHEFGHVLGLDHADHGVMGAEASDARVTREDCP